jgi:predicted RNase H-like HicB family nuclease
MWRSHFEEETMTFTQLRDLIFRVNHGTPEVPSRAEQYLRDRSYLTFNMTYGEEEGWFLYAEELEGVLLYADTVSEALYLLDDALDGHVEAVLAENGSQNGKSAHLDGILGQDEPW